MVYNQALKLLSGLVSSRTRGSNPNAQRAYFLSTVTDLLRDEVLGGEDRKVKVLDIGSGASDLASLLDKERFSYTAIREGRADIILVSDLIFRSQGEGKRATIIRNIAESMTPFSVLIFSVSDAADRDEYDDLLQEHGLHFVDDGLLIHTLPAVTLHPLFRTVVHFARKT